MRWHICKGGVCVLGGWEVCFCPCAKSLYFFWHISMRRASPEGEMANRRHISVNIRYLFPLQPVNTDKRQQCAVLRRRISRDFVHPGAHSLSAILSMCGQRCTLGLSAIKVQ